MNRLILGLAVFASVATALPALANAQPVDAREASQQHRIVQGVRSGELTPRETHRLERREAALHVREAVMRSRHGGRLTYRERVRLNHSENRLSRAIYRAKHNMQVD